MRVQNPELERTDESPRPNRSQRRPRWFIRVWVDEIDETGTLKRARRRKYLGLCKDKCQEGITKREAEQRKNRVLDLINRTTYIVQSQGNFGEFVNDFEREHLRKLAASTREKYRNHMKNHIRPAFGHLMMCEVTTRAIEDYLHTARNRQNGKPLAWATRTDIKNLLGVMFQVARKWGVWRETNPAELVDVGRKRPAREKRKLSIEDTNRLLAALPPVVALMCKVALFCTLRISEVLGLQWKHVDLKRGRLYIRQRYWRGDLDDVKSEKGRRDPPLGHLVDYLAALRPGEPDEWVFSAPTHCGRRVSRDDRDLNQHFLRPAAKALGLYYEGFGFHAFRREAVTGLAQEGGRQADQIAGHSRPMAEYLLSDFEAQDRAVRAWQERFLEAAPKGEVQ